MKTDPVLVDWATASDRVPAVPRRAADVLSAVIRASLLLAAAAGLADRSGVVSAAWSAFVGM